ncbi:cellulase family glycosylhydrolase [Butyrivibrio sp. AE3006]|uniref:cellulase family glycosylhydrolase n=1 Tax=Butyrivibrio sp. AE3006 TaxID=1280673 RepID=UPI000403D370|nr:carbohydrate binding domain-containing protein [Butyrivibrio sp. AE3006]
MKISKSILSLIVSAGLLVSSAMPVTANAASTEDIVGFKNYITVSGTKLMDGDKELKFVSLNYPQATSDTPWEHANAMKTFRAMGGNVTRTYTIPAYNGENADTAYVTGVDENGQLTFNEDALNALDDVLAKANQYGIRVIVPFVDHWFWIGGMDSYVWLAGESEGKKPTQSGFQEWAWKFYSSEKCMDMFKQMITHLLNRTNTVTGIKYKDDPAVLCWETGNEIGNRSQVERDDELAKWTNEVVEHVKSIDSNHLVLDGRMSMAPKSLSDENKADILGAHYYEGNYAQRCEDDTRSAHEAGKPFILGEFGAKVTAKPCIDVFQKGVENDTNGIMMWSLRAHKDGYGFYFHNEDGYWASYHWPGFEAGNYYGETEIIRSIYAYAQIANGKASNYEEAAAIPIPAPETEEAPLLYSENGVSHDNSFTRSSVGDIKWRGVVGGAWYEIQRAEGTVTDQDSETFVTIAGEEDYVYDSGRNWEDKAHDCIAGYHDETAVDGHTYSYRVRACNESGVGLWSNIVTVENVNHVVKDDLDLIAVSSNDPNPTEIRRTYSSDHSANIEQSGSSVVNKSSEEGYIEYFAKIPADQVEITAVSEAKEGSEPRVMVSTDDITFEEAAVTHSPGSKSYTASDICSAGNYYFVRVYLQGKSSCKLDAIEITYKNDGLSYFNEENGTRVKTNVLIQDNTFGVDAEPFYVSKDESLAVRQNGDIRGLTTEGTESGSIIYKTGDDINAYRVSTVSLNGENVRVEYSFDGVSFKDAGELTESSVDGVTRKVYGNLNVSEAVRVIRVIIPEGCSEDVFVSLVEISSGNKMIPLTEGSPDNTIEDGEFYFGQDSVLNSFYQIKVAGGEVSFSKGLDGKDYSAYDCIFAWVKPDGSGNDLAIRLCDDAGNIWESEKITLGGASEMKRLPITKDGDFNWSCVMGAEFVILGKDGSSSMGGAISLDENSAYSGNYGVKLSYSFDGEGDSSICIDSIYAGSSTKVDDFEGYSGSNTLLNQAYSRNTNGGSFGLSLDSGNKSEGSYGLRIDYDYDGKGYAGATKTMNLLNLSGYDGFIMYIDSDGSGNEIKVQMETESSTYAYTGYMTGKGPMTLYMPFSKIVQPDWATSGTPQPIDSAQNLKSVSIYTNQTGTVTSGTFYVDDLKGANFVEELTANTRVSIDEVPTEITEFPYVITGTAEFVKYVTVTAGDKKFNVPVNADGGWNYKLTEDSGIKNSDDLRIRAGFYYPDGEPIAESVEYSTKLMASGNNAPQEEHYDNVIWSWNFGESGMDGWSLEEFTPKLEDGRLVAWSQDGYEAVFSYTVSGVPNGVYTLSNDIKVKSNMNSAVMALFSGDEEVTSSPIDTADVIVEDQLLGEKLTVRNNTVTVKYYVSAPADANGVTFAVGDIKLYLVETIEDNQEQGEDPGEGGQSGEGSEAGEGGNESGQESGTGEEGQEETPVEPVNVILNGDFEEVEADWPNLPLYWEISSEGADYPVKGENGKFVGYTDEGNPYTFTISQTINDLPAGTYTLSAEIELLNEGFDNSISIAVNDSSAEVNGDITVGEARVVELTDIEIVDGVATVSISGDFTGKGLKVDNVQLIMTKAAEQENAGEEQPGEENGEGGQAEAGESAEQEGGQSEAGETGGEQSETGGAGQSESGEQEGGQSEAGESTEQEGSQSEPGSGQIEPQNSEPTEAAKEDSSAPQQTVNPVSDNAKQTEAGTITPKKSKTVTESKSSGDRSQNNAETKHTGTQNREEVSAGANQGSDRDSNTQVGSQNKSGLTAKQTDSTAGRGVLGASRNEPALAGRNAGSSTESGRTAGAATDSQNSGTETDLAKASDKDMADAAEMSDTSSDAETEDAETEVEVADSAVDNPEEASSISDSEEADSMATDSDENEQKSSPLIPLSAAATITVLIGAAYFILRLKH